MTSVALSLGIFKADGPEATRLFIFGSFYFDRVSPPRKIINTVLLTYL